MVGVTMETSAATTGLRELVAFERFGPAHLAVLGITLTAMVVLVATGRRFRGHPLLKWKERLLVAALVLTYPAKVAVLLVEPGASLDYRLPMHLCDVAAYVAAFALVARNRRAAEVAYFWGLGGTLQGLITPAVGAGFPHPEFFRFFLLHSSVVIAACYLAFGTGMSPERGAVWRAFGWAQVYLVVAAVVNLLTGANYGFLCEPPESGSLIDLLGPWPWYLVSLELLALVAFAVLNLPFVVARRLGGEAKAAVLVVSVMGAWWPGHGALLAAGEEDPMNRGRRIFNGRDLSGWETWLRAHGRADPDGVFSVRDGAIAISGDGFGYLATRERFADFRLSCEWRWGEGGNASRRGKARDSGLFLHASGPHGNSHDGEGAYMAAIEVNLFEGAVGDFLLIRGDAADGSLIAPRLAAEAAPRRDADGWPTWQPGGERVELSTWGRLNWKHKAADWKDVAGFRGPRDPERAPGEWNRLEVTCRDASIEVRLNGELVNRAERVSPSSGRILLQCEGSAIAFRDLRVESLEGTEDNRSGDPGAAAPNVGSRFRPRRSIPPSLAGSGSPPGTPDGWRGTRGEGAASRCHRNHPASLPGRDHEGTRNGSVERGQSGPLPLGEGKEVGIRAAPRAAPPVRPLANGLLVVR